MCVARAFNTDIDFPVITTTAPPCAQPSIDPVLSVIDTETAIQLIGELYWSCAGITANASTLEIEVLANSKNGELLKS